MSNHEDANCEADELIEIIRDRLDMAWKRAGNIDGCRSEISWALEAIRRLSARRPSAEPAKDAPRLPYKD